MTKKETQLEKTEEREVFRLSEADSHFKYEVSKIPGAEKLMLCFQCGTCTADCPVARFSGSYRPIQILRMAQLGMKERVLSSDDIWLCATCFTCTDRCPQGVEFASVLRALRNMAVEEGIIPPGFKEIASIVLKTGLANEITKLRLKKREEAGLPPLPGSNPERMTKLADIVGFSKLIEKKETKNV